MKKAKFGKTGYPVVTVCWEDSTAYTGWQTIARPRKPQTVYSTGYLVQESKRTVSISAHVDPDGDTTEVMVIPRGCITSLRRHGL
jgi:hypothetical protein